MTNYEKIKAMTLDELADTIVINHNCEGCSLDCSKYGYDCTETIKAWLSEDATTICESCPFALTGDCHFTYHNGTLYCTREALEGKEVPEVETVTFTWVQSAPIPK